MSMLNGKNPALYGNYEVFPKQKLLLMRNLCVSLFQQQNHDANIHQLSFTTN